MGIQRIRFQDFDKVVDLYKSKTIDQLQLIKPKWTYPKDSDYMLNSALKPEENEYSIFLVDTKILMEKSEFLEFNPKVLFTGEYPNDGRVATILYRWDNNLFIDPPVVEVFNRRKNTLCFADGRHRTKTAFLLGNKKIPVAINKESVENVNRLIDLKLL